MIRNPPAIRRSIERCQRMQRQWAQREIRMRAELLESTRRVDMCVALRDQGWSFRAIGEACGVTTQMAYQILNPHVGVARAERERVARHAAR